MCENRGKTLHRREPVSFPVGSHEDLILHCYGAPPPPPLRRLPHLQLLHIVLIWMGSPSCPHRFFLWHEPFLLKKWLSGWDGLPINQSLEMNSLCLVNLLLLVVVFRIYSRLLWKGDNIMLDSQMQNLIRIKVKLFEKNTIAGYMSQLQV
jgi:hypothetical protein